MAYDSSIHFNNFDQNTSTNTHRALRNDIRVANNTMHPTSSQDNAAVTQPTNIFIFANGCIVGMIQSLQVSESRDTKVLQAIGWEGVVQQVPNNYKGGQLTVNRIALYESSLWNALGLATTGVPFNEIGKKTYEETSATSPIWDTARHEFDNSGNKVHSRLAFKTLKDQRVPLEIQTKTRREGSSDDFYVETYIDCWLSAYGKTYGVNDITVTENATIKYADVY